MARLKNLTERGRDTQRELRNALIELSLEKGYENVTIRDITEHTGLDRSTFYLHYKDKHQLLEQSQKQLIDELVARSQEVGNPGDGIEIAFQHMAENAGFYRVLMGLEGDRGINRRLFDYLAGRISERLQERARQLGLEPSLPVEMLAHYYTGALRGIAIWWLEHNEQYSPGEMARIFQKLVTQGILSLASNG